MSESIESENLRRAATEQLNREGIPDDYDGELWDTEALTRDFEVEGFAAPCVVVRRRSDGVRGSLYFTHSPRIYFDFQPVS